MAMSVSVQKSSSRTNIKHNNRDMSEKEKQKNSHIDHSRSYQNRYMVRENIKAVYECEFGEALEQYNAKQKRNDRKIKDYYQHIAKSKKTSTQQEMIIQIGDKDDFQTEEQRQMAKEMLLEYFESFEERNPQLRVYNAVIHMDEASPHMHLNFVPVATDYKRGLEKQVAFDRAIKQQDKTLNKEKPFDDWRNKEVAVLTEILQERNIERKLVGANRYRDVNEYKEQKDLLKEFEKQIGLKKSEYLSLSNDVEKIKSEATEWAVRAEKHAENSKVLEKRNKALETEIEANKEYVDTIKDTVSKIPEWVISAEVEYETEKVKDGLFKTSLERTGRVIVDGKAFNSLKVLAKGTNVLKSEMRANEREVKDLHSVIEWKTKEIASLKETIKEKENLIIKKDEKINRLEKQLDTWREATVSFFKNAVVAAKEKFGEMLGRHAHGKNYEIWNTHELLEPVPEKDFIRKGFELGLRREQDKEFYIELMCEVEKRPEIATEYKHAFHSCGNREKSMDPSAIENMISVRLEAIEQFKSRNKNTWYEYAWVGITENYWKVMESKLNQGEDISKLVVEEPDRLSQKIHGEREADVIIPMRKKASREIDRGWGLER